MKRIIMMLLALAAMLCICASAEKASSFNPVDAERISVEMPDGMAADIRIEDGILRVVIDDAATDWKRVLCSGGGYPYIRIRPTIQKPNSSVTGHYAFNGSIDSISDDYIIRSLESDIARYESDHLTWSNGEDVGEVVAERSIFIPRNSADPSAPPEEWGGTVICWVDKNNPDYRYFEKAVFCITHTNSDPFHVPLRFVSANTLSPVKSMTMPSNVELTKVENGEVTFTVTDKSGSEAVRLSVPMQAPSGAEKAYVVHEGGYKQELPIENGIATIDGIDYWNLTNVDERQYTVLWTDANGELLDYGLMWVHVVPAENDPWACYVDNWYPVDEDRVLIYNFAEGCGVEVTYNPENGIAHVGYDNSVEITSEPGTVAIHVVPPEGAVCYRSNHSGGNVIMGDINGLEEDQKNVMLLQDYQMVYEDTALGVRDYRPLREVQAGPVSVYIQEGDVWPYGGGVFLIYWYDSVESAVNNPGEPMLAEFVCDTNDMLCQVKRTPITPSEDEITEPVKDITAVGDYGGWNLVVKRRPQKGSNAFHWELTLENETGVYQPLTENMVFYVPYPKGHDNHTTYTYELRHYDDDHSSFSLVDVQRTEYGLRFEVSSLSPFVFSWTEIDVTGRILTLPAELNVIEEEAFTSLYVGSVVLGENVQRIEKRAFADCSLTENINLPASIEFIAEDAFSGCEKLTAAVTDGSYAHQWCEDNNFPFVLE